MAGTVKRLAGPVALSNTYTTNVYNQASALLFDVVRHIHVTNKSGVAATFRLFLGATGANAAGTELFYDQNVAAGGSFEWYGGLRLASTDFIVGGASAATALTITIEGESNVV